MKSLKFLSYILMKKQYLYLFCMVALAFFGGVYLEYNRPAKYEDFLNFSKGVIKTLELKIVLSEDARACNLMQIPNIPSNSYLVIGHFYGHPSISNENTLGKLSDFIFQNKLNLKAVIFTGDIFKNPSLEKWELLQDVFNKSNVKYFIAPGNHDVGIADGPARDIFKLSFKADYPILLKDKDSILLIEDTTINNWNLSTKSLNLIQDNISAKKNLYIFTHNIILEELSIVANSRVGKPKMLNSAASIINGLEKDYNKVNIISGDTGAHAFLPAYSCYLHKNILSIANGVGSRDLNYALVINQDEIFSLAF